MPNSDLQCLVLGYRYLEDAMGWDRRSDPIEQGAQLSDLEAEGQLCLLDAAHLIRESECVEAIGRQHVRHLEARAVVPPIPIS